MGDPPPKRYHVSVEDTVAKALATRKLLEAQFADMKVSFLSDPTRVWKLSRPTNYFDAQGNKLEQSYSFVGREAAQSLLDEISGVRCGQRIQILGAKGTGKSTVVVAIAGYIIGKGQPLEQRSLDFEPMPGERRWLVYISAAPFVEIPLTVLVDSLVTAMGEAGGFLDWLASVTRPTLEAVLEWCMGQRRGSLLFVIDDYDHLCGHSLEQQFLMSAGRHCFVKVSSVNSREMQIWSTDDKQDDKVQTIHFDGPYTKAELDTWLAQSSLTSNQLGAADNLTGGVPRLLRFYEEVNGDSVAFTRKIKDLYTSMFFGLLDTQDQLKAALDLVLFGNVEWILEDRVNFSCLYRKDDGTFDLLSPFLRSQAERFIMDHQVLQYSDVQTWSEAVQLDCEKNVKNSARLGWNVEGLVMGVMRYRKIVFGYAFKHFVTYEPGHEQACLESLRQDMLKEGVLLGPVMFSEQAVDVILVILVDKRLKILAMQITVAKWKAKLKKQPHEVWRKELLPRWTLRNKRWTSTETKFIYINPRTFDLEDVVDAEVKRLGDVDPCLEGFDDMLDLPEPCETDKKVLKQCTGIFRSGTHCLHRALCSESEYRCCQHQVEFGSSPNRKAII